VNYSKSPAELGIIVTPTAAAVVNVGGGLVGINAPLHGLLSGREITMYGSTNYTGYHTLDASTTVNQIRFPATYVAETLTATAGIQPNDSYTPDWGVAYDDVLEYFCAREGYSRDKSSKVRDAEWAKWNALYTKAKGNLYVGAAGGGLSIKPSRG
jgi:choline dehydrogenase-like flavoprotein